MKTEPINIEVNFTHRKGRAKKFAIDGVAVSDLFAVTPTVYSADRTKVVLSNRRYTITHRPTGWAAAINVGRKLDAVMLAREIEAEGVKHQIDWTLTDPKALGKLGAWDRLSAWWLARRKPFLLDSGNPSKKVLTVA